MGIGDSLVLGKLYKKQKKNLKAGSSLWKYEKGVTIYCY